MGNVKTVEAKIARLEALNTAAQARIVELRANFANEWQVINATRGIRYREAKIAALRA